MEEGKIKMEEDKHGDEKLGDKSLLVASFWDHIFFSLCQLP